MLLALGACSPYPADIRGSLEEARTGSLQVGVIDNPPWIEWNDGAPRGVEADLIRRFAADQQLEVKWRKGGEEALMAALEHADLHIVAAGASTRTPWKKRLTLSEPIATCRAHIGMSGIAASAAEDVGFEEMEVRVERATGMAGLVKKTGAIPVTVESLAEGSGPAAAEDYRLAELGLTPAGDPLQKTTHVLFLPHGENALYAALTRSLPASPGCPPLEDEAAP